MKVAYNRQVRSIDQRASNDFGVPSLLLMENAGAGVAAAAQRLLPDGSQGPVLVLAGKGNNGGDGLVAARHLQAAGLAVTVALFADPQDLTGDARTNLEIAQRCGLDISIVRSEAELGGLAGLAYLGPALVIDALLGTGVTGAPRGLMAAGIRFVNGMAAPVLAVDIPSGLDADTGRAEGDCVRATCTVTMGCLKPGLLQYPGRDLAGEVQVVSIGWPLPAVQAEKLSLAVTTAAEAAALLPRRRPDAHKGDAGHLFVAAGSRGLTGAAALTSLAGLRSGAGLVTLGTPASQQPVLAGRLTEVMTLALPETASQSLAEAALPAILEFLEHADALALGPGFGRDPGSAALVRQLAVAAPRPAVVDADALHALAGQLDLLRGAVAPRVLTPHPGEMAVLLGRPVQDVQGDRIGAAREAARLASAVVVLKGAPTVIASPDGEVRLNPTGNAALATAGSGDVLTGMIGGLLAQGCSAWDAAVVGVYLHGICGDLAAAAVGPVGALAGDFLDRIPAGLQRVTKRGA
ncbi:MAG: NAD(P)H-hydrate dehydratase [Symbiobacteriia bacterium]